MCDATAPKVWADARVTARKAYACEECTTPIDVGEPYVRVGALHEGSWGTYRFCLFCYAFAREAVRAGVCHAVGELYECALGWVELGSHRRLPDGRHEYVPPLLREGDQELANRLAGRRVYT